MPTTSSVNHPKYEDDEDYMEQNKCSTSPCQGFSPTYKVMCCAGGCRTIAPKNEVVLSEEHPTRCLPSEQAHLQGTLA